MKKAFLISAMLSMVYTPLSADHSASIASHCANAAAKNQIRYLVLKDHNGIIKRFEPPEGQYMRVGRGDTVRINYVGSKGHHKGVLCEIVAIVIKK